MHMLAMVAGGGGGCFGVKKTRSASRTRYSDRHRESRLELPRQ